MENIEVLVVANKEMILFIGYLLVIAFGASGMSKVIEGFEKSSHPVDVALNSVNLLCVVASITIAVFLFVMFRRIYGVLLPLAVVILSLSSTIGIMAGTGIPLTVPTQIIPTFLMAVGVGAAVHIL